MPRFTKEEQEILKKLLSEEPEDSEKPAESTEKGADEHTEEEFIVFRGSPQSFFEAFGVAPPGKTENPDSETTEDGPAQAPKKEPQARTRSRYFGA